MYNYLPRPLARIADFLTLGLKNWSFLIKNNLWYTLSAVSAQVCQGGVLLSALYFLSPEQVGLFSLSMSICSCMSLWLSLGLRQVLVLDYYSTSPSHRAKLVGSIATLYIYSLPFTLSIALPACFYFLSYTTQLLFLERLALVLLIIANGFIVFFSEGVHQVGSYRGEIRWLAANKIKASAVLFSISFMGIINLPVVLSVYILLLAPFLGNSFIAYTGLVKFKQDKIVQALSHKEIKQIARTYIARGIAFLPSLISAWVLQISNRWVIAAQCNLRDVAFYSLSDYVYVLFSTCLLLPLGATYVPVVLEQFSQAKTSHEHKTIDTANLKRMLLYMCFLLVASFVFYKPAQLVFYWIMPELYRPCLPLMYMRFVGLVFFLGTYFTTCFIQFMRKSRFLIWSLVVTASINMFLALIITRYYGAVGALASLGFAQFFYFILTISYNMYLHKRVATQNIHRDDVLYDELCMPNQHNSLKSSENHAQL